MMNLVKPIHQDERTRADYGRVAGIWLGITQVLIGGIYFYRLYVMRQPDEQLSDLRLVLLVSVFGHLFAQLVYGGRLPVPTWRGMIAVYVVLTGAIAGISLAVHGVPAPDEWTSTWLPAFLGPALIIAIYRIAAWLGRRRIERMIGE